MLLGRRLKAGSQYSSKFEREGDSWRLKLLPMAACYPKAVSLYLELVLNGKGDNYRVERCFTLRALHPTDAAANEVMASSGHQFSKTDGWGSARFLTSATGD